MFALTLDIDWAPDPVVDYVAGRLIEKRVKATWFVTHDSPAVRRLIKYQNLFEIGIHPYFHPTSTQGTDEISIVENLLALVPYAKSVRMHGLLHSSNILRILALHGIENDVSLYLPDTQNIVPHRLHFPEGASILRLPYVWEDDFEMCKPQPCFSPDGFLKINQVAILDFHPIHIVLNSRTSAIYERERSNNWRGLDKYLTYKNETGDRAGTRDMFESCLNLMEGAGQTIMELAKQFKAAQ